MKHNCSFSVTEELLSNCVHIDEHTSEQPVKAKCR